MAWNITERFPSWGETGEFPAAGFFYEGGDQVNEKHLDALWNGVNGLEEDVQAALNDIDSDSDGEVDAADIARALDSSEVGDGLNGGDGTALSVDVSDFAGTGLADDGNENLYIPQGGGSGLDADSVDGQDYADIQNWVNNNADVPNADYADNAGDADTVDGLEASELQITTGEKALISAGL